MYIHFQGSLVLGAQLVHCQTKQGLRLLESRLSLLRVRFHESAV